MRGREGVLTVCESLGLGSFQVVKVVRALIQWFLRSREQRGGSLVLSRTRCLLGGGLYFT